MAKEASTVEVYGEITEALGNSRFNVEIENGVTLKNCTISGKIRKNYIKLVPGDQVRVALSVYDLTTGRIEERLYTYIPNQQPQNNNNSRNNKNNKKRKKK